jgi:flagellar protein FlgJ
MNNSALLPTTQPINIDTTRYTSQYDRLDNYNDINALQSIKYQSKSDKDGALDAAAKHFESIFVSMMVKSMRDANKVFSEGNMLQSSETEFYQQMFDSQLSVSLSTGRGIGLAEVIKRQLSKESGVPKIDIPAEGLPLKGFSANGQARQSSDGVDDRKFFSLENYVRLPSISPQKAAELEETANSIDDLIAKLPIEKQTGQLLLDGSELDNTRFNSNDTNVIAASAQKQTELPLKFEGPEDFIASLYPFAKEVESKTGIDARLMLAQSALETGWGKHPILKKDGSPSFNLFGIKANSAWEGEAAEITTTEFRGGLAMKEQANFRTYSSYEDSFNDYAQFLRTNDRYQDALAISDQPKAFAKELQDAGYATDPNYAEKIGSIVDRYFEGLSSERPKLTEGSSTKTGLGTEG